MRVFPNDDSAYRLIGAVLADINDAWSERIYLNFGGLWFFFDDCPVGCNWYAEWNGNPIPFVGIVKLTWFQGEGAVK